jgi:hypothetical protein
MSGSSPSHSTTSSSSFHSLSRALALRPLARSLLLACPPPSLTFSHLSSNRCILGPLDRYDTSMKFSALNHPVPSNTSSLVLFLFLQEALTLC